MDGMNMRRVQIEGGPVVNTGNGVTIGYHIGPLGVARWAVNVLECTGDAVVVGLQSGVLQLRLIANLDHVVWSRQVHNGGIIHCCVSPSGTEIVTVSREEAPAIISM
jgi:hypothetical protein